MTSAGTTVQSTSSRVLPWMGGPSLVSAPGRMRNLHTQNTTTVSTITKIGTQAISSTSYSVEVRLSWAEPCDGNQLIESTTASSAAVATTATRIICRRGRLRTAV